MQELNDIEKGQLCQATIESLYRVTGGLSNFPGLLKRIIETKAWEKRVSKGKVIELANLRELITEKPIRGWGEDPKKVEAVIKDDPEALAMFREAMKAKRGGDHTTAEGKEQAKHNNVMDCSTGGNSRAYSIARVQRECDPETVSAVMAGEMSPNAALVAAGVRENRQVYIPRDPAKAVGKLVETFGEGFVCEMIVAFGMERIGE
jgi:hypothetical protein